MVPNLWCIGDANGKMMLAHAASAQGVSAIEVRLRRVCEAGRTNPGVSVVVASREIPGDTSRTDLSPRTPYVGIRPNPFE